MPPDVYSRIGVRTFINCAGVRTVHGGSLMLPEVVAAMTEASGSFVNIDELMQGASRRLAELTGAQAGIVTSGCAAALCHATAAAITGGDPEKMIRLPRTQGFTARVIMPRPARFTYDHAIRMVGAQIVEVATRDEFFREIAKPTSMIALLGVAEHTLPVRLDEMAAAARAHDVPVLVDAAAEVLERPNPYLTRGASMVAYSGGKYLRGPQSAGLLLGDKRWIDLAWMQAAPHHSFGRPMKTGKEEIVGMLAAVETWYSTRSFESEYATWRESLSRIAATVGRCSGVSSRIPSPGSPVDRIPRLEIHWNPVRVPITADQVRTALLDGEPRIMLDDRGASSTSLMILPFSLQPGHAEIVGDRLLAVLQEASGNLAGNVSTDDHPAIALNGTWDILVQYRNARAAHTITILDDAQQVSGTHRTTYSEQAIGGTRDGRALDLLSLHPYEGTSLAFRFRGLVDTNSTTMSGELEIGTTGQAAPGPLNMREFGTAAWRASRRSP